MEDFFFLERDDGTEAAGKFDLGGKTVNFHAWSYSGLYRINIDGTKYPSVNFNANTNEVRYAFEDTFTKSNETKALTGKEWPDEVPVPKGDPSALIAARCEDLCRQAHEMPPEPELDIPSQIAAGMGDVDEFEEDVAGYNMLYHVINGKKIYVRDVQDIQGEDIPEIKELPVKKTLSDPPLPKGLHRNKDYYRKKANPKDPRFDEWEPNPDYKPPWA